jgi:pyruvate carboxylase subunit B
MADYFMPPEAKAVEPLIPWSPMPGGALTANTQMMRDHGIMDRYPEVIAAMGEVVRLGGFGTSVTPVSQFYFQQAFNNVMFGKWEKFAVGYGKMVLGYFGKTPVPPDPEIVRRAAEKMGMEPTTESPLEMDEHNPKKGLAPAEAKLREEKLPITEENIFIVAACGAKGISFLKGEMKTNVRKISKEHVAASEGNVPDKLTVNVGGEKFAVEFHGDQATVNGRSYDVSISEGQDHAAAASGSSTPLEAPMPGIVLEIRKRQGDVAQEGETVIMLEAMKMEMAVASPITGTISEIRVSKGDHVVAGQTLATLD